MTKKRMFKPKPDDDKLRELILHISLESEGDEYYGATKLNKLLFLADLTAYRVLGKPITGQEYQAIPHGPAPRRLAPVRDRMRDAGEIGVREIDFYSRKQHRIIALILPDISKFDAGEIAIVDRLIRRWWGKSAREISDYVYEILGGRIAEEGETIPYEVALVGNREPTSDEIKRGKELEPLAAKYLSS